MRISFVAVLFMIFIFGSVWGAFASTEEDFEEVVDFSITLKSLNRLLEDNQAAELDKDRFVIVSGTVSSIAFLDKKKNSYTVQLELVSGEWIELEEVKSYKCRIIFRGPQFYTLIPRRIPKGGATNDMVVESSRVIIIAIVVEPVETEQGEEVWLLDGHYIRTH